MGTSYVERNICMSTKEFGMFYTGSSKGVGCKTPIEVVSQCVMQNLKVRLQKVSEKVNRMGETFLKEHQQ